MSVDRNYVGRVILWVGITTLLNTFFLTGCSQGNNSDQEESCENKTIVESGLEQQETNLNMPAIESELAAEGKKSNSQVAVKRIAEEYEVKLYDKAHNEVFSMTYPKEPWIVEVTENVLEIGCSTGSPARNVFYFDKDSGRVSAGYMNSRLIREKYVAYMENGELVFTDLFNDEIYQKIKRDFSPAVDPVISIEMLDRQTILLNYYKGNDFLEVQEEIDIGVAEPEIPAEKSVWEHCDLSMGNGPDYQFFENAGEGGYHITLENLVAYALVDYADKVGMGEEEWTLKRIIYRDNHYHAFVKSDSGDHIYILIDGDWDVNERYIVMADIRKDENAGIELGNGYAYNSGLTWHSYKEYSDGIREPKTDYKIDGGSGMSDGGMYDSMYESAGTYAMYAYLDSIGEKSCRWEIERNSAYMGSGFIADVSFTSGSRRVSMLIDVCNATYAVLDESITSDAG